MEIIKGIKRIILQDGDSALKKFYEELNNKKLTTTKCKSCNKQFFPPKSICPDCFGDDICWVELSGKGRIYAFTQHDRSLLFGKPDVIGIVELEEGHRLFTKIDGKFDELKIGDEVKVDFIKVGDDFTLHKFVPV